MRLAIIGAGMAGLSAAQRLRALCPESAIVIFEQEQRVGGRVSTTTQHGARFDDGAQYIKAPNAALEALLRAESVDAPPLDIGLPVWTFDAQGTIMPGDAAQNAAPKWTYRAGLARLAQILARELDVRCGVRIGRIARANGSYLLFDEHATIVGAADAVLLTPPAPQSAAIIAASALPPQPQQTLLAELGRVGYRPCLSLTFGLPPLLRARPWYALVNIDRRHPISWLAYEHLKPGRAEGQHLLLSQMAAQWSREHWQAADDEIAAQVLALIAALLQEDVPAPRWTALRRWPYALPERGADANRLNQTLPGIFFAGDYTAGQGRVHLAIEQGWRIAEQIAAFAPAGG